jgi:tripartite ATP-independent transporter DctM subunit
MGVETATILIVVGMIVLMLMGLPLGVVTLTMSITVALIYFGPPGLLLISANVFGLMNNYALVAVPMFVLMASIMERSGIARDLFDAMALVAGGLRGGVAVQTCLAGVILAAMTGIMGGEMVMLGLIALPQMLRLGYEKKLAIGTILSGGSLGTLIPPSVMMIVYGLTANVSIGDLFLAGVGPGLLLASLYIAYILVRCHLNPSLAPVLPEEMRRIPLSQKLKSLRGLILPAIVVIWIMGSIYGGIASITESAAVGVCGAMLAAAARRELNWPMVRDAVVQTTLTVGSILWLIIGAISLVGIFTVIGGVSYVKGIFAGMPFSPVVIILIMMGILIVLGTFMEWIAICFLTMPIFVPVVTSLGFDPVWFGVLFVVNMQIYFLSPPFGPACFWLKSVTPPDISLQQIFASVWPFICLQVVGLLAIVFFPQIALWLPYLFH